MLNNEVTWQPLSDEEFLKAVIEEMRKIIGLLPDIWGDDDDIQTAEQARRRLWGS